MSHDPSFMNSLAHAAMDTAMQAKFGIMRGQWSERELAETMQRVPADVLEAKIREIEAQAAWLRGWRVRPAPDLPAAEKPERTGGHG